MWQSCWSGVYLKMHDPAKYEAVMAQFKKDYERDMRKVLERRQQEAEQARKKAEEEQEKRRKSSPFGSLLKKK